MDKRCDEAGNSEDQSRFRLFNIPVGDAIFRAKYKKIQSACYNFLERPCGVVSVSYHFVVFGLVVTGLVFAILETMEGFKHNNDIKTVIYVLEVFLLSLFTSEYILRMWSAGCKSTYVGLLGRICFAFKPFVVVDLIVIGSTSAVIISSIGSSSAISVLRFFQVLRMVRFDRQGSSWKLLGSVLFLHRQELLTTFYIGFCSFIFASFFVYQAEKSENTEFESFADSFWWGIVTLTTVGYGDKVPKSWTGRGVAAFFAIMGISFFALPAGILGSGFALKVSQQQRQKHAKRRRRPAAMLIQCNWRYYASRKDSKSLATWFPYVRYLQEIDSKREGKHSRRLEMTLKDDPTETGNSERPGRTRKISIFGRKSSDTLPASTPENFKSRRNKSLGNALFHSTDSLPESQSYSTAEPHTDDEHTGNSRIRRTILVADDDGNFSLPAAYKQSIRFTRYLKFLVALRKFKLAKRPYDVKDVIEQYSTGHVELLGKVKGIAYKIDDALGYKVGTEKLNENSSNSRTNVVHRLSKLEKQVRTLDFKLDKVISLLEKTERKEFPVIKTSLDLDEGNTSSCGTSNKQNSKKSSTSSPVPSSVPSQVIEGHRTPVRRRKLAVGNFLVPSETNDGWVDRQAIQLDEGHGENGEGKMDDQDKDATMSDVPERASHLTTGTFEQGIGRSANNDSDNESSVEKQPDRGASHDNYLSPKPFGCENYDLRPRSDSAFSSVCSELKKSDGNSSGVTPSSSDSECTSSSVTVVEPGAHGSSYFGEASMQETKM